MLLGIAKPTPSKPPDSEAMAVLMPDHLPLQVQQGSAAIAAVDGGIRLQEDSDSPLGRRFQLRPLALMMPWVTVCSRPRGLPMATTHSPTSTLSESANLRKGKGSLPEILITAKSVFGCVTDPLGNVFPAVRKHHLNFGCFAYDVAVREDIALRIDENTRPDSDHFLLKFLWLFWDVKEAAQERVVFKGKQGIAYLRFFSYFHMDNRGYRRLGDPGNTGD